MGLKTYFTKKKNEAQEKFAICKDLARLSGTISKVEVPKSKLPLLLYVTQKNKPTLIKKCQMTSFSRQKIYKRGILKLQETKERRRREPWAEELWCFRFSPSQIHSNPVLQNCCFLHFYFSKLYSDSMKWKMIAIANYKRRRFFIVSISLETAWIYNLVFKLWLSFLFLFEIFNFHFL